MLDIGRAKAHLRVDWDDAAHDALIAAYLAAAIGAVERRTGRVLVERALTQRLTAWPVGRDGGERIELWHDPVVSVEGVDIVGADGATATLTKLAGEFRVVAGEPYLLLPPSGQSFPALASQPGAATVRYTAGYGGTAGQAPAELEIAALMMLGHLYQNRESVAPGVASEVPLGVDALCWPWQRIRL